MFFPRKVKRKKTFFEIKEKVQRVVQLAVLKTEHALPRE